MALRDILIEGDPALTKRSRPVKKFDDRLASLIDDMIETMYDGDGVGLAAPQVGVLRRIFVMDLDDGEGPFAFVNPEIVESEGDQEGPEGCLSLPGLFGIVNRPMTVTVRAVDRHGNPFEKTVEGLGARCVCHENDHLDGILFRRHSQIPLCALEDLPGGEEEEQEQALLSDEAGELA
ncbi:MAG: peptide deformylase [Clostridiales bacterium]|jgi:peptide deformylase|nr:peptide deformylase [Clostridiales bacterium]MDD2571874.1 peptide deformylase [Eubacteriales bacterium]MDY0119211.1 peptide deformylase [Clostridia bacterium]NLG30400.1 peptide deformylase [Clostridiaceae bacterium]MCK9350349.1 peptide deformylase [Clostridiales bacterium]